MTTSIKLEKFKLKRAVFQVDYTPCLRYLSEVGRLGAEIQTSMGADHIHSDGTSKELTLRNIEKKQWTFLGLLRLRTMWNDFERFEDFQSFSENVYRRAFPYLWPKQLKQSRGKKTTKSTSKIPNDVTRLGCRIAYLAEATECEFDDLNKFVLDKFFDADFLVAAKFSKQDPSDSMIVLDFKSGTANGHLEIGPLLSEQAASLFNEDKPDDCPPLSLMVDCDYGMQKGKAGKLPDLNHFLLQSHKEIEATIKKLSKHLEV